MNGKEGLYAYRAEDIWYHGAGIQHTTKLTASQEVTYIFDETIVMDLEKKACVTAGIAYSEEAQKFMRSVEKRLCKGPCSQKQALTSEPIQY